VTGVQTCALPISIIIRKFFKKIATIIKNKNNTLISKAKIINKKEHSKEILTKCQRKKNNIFRKINYLSK
jgi:hypothetical protein